MFLSERVMQVGSGGPRNPEIAPARVLPDLTSGETTLPTISCIIPTLERGEVLCDTVRMLFGQTYLAHQIIVVDQTLVHSTATGRTLAEWAADERILWFRQREPNASSARNLGARAATGDVILFLDDDVRIGPDFLASYVEVLRQTGAAGVCGPVHEDPKNTVETLNPKVFTSEFGWLLHFRKNYARACETSFMMSGNVAIRREMFLALGGMDENYEQGAHREESDFAVRFRQAGYWFWYDPRCAIHHLGPALVPGGGARAHAQGNDFRYFHHCVGDWYFNLKFCTAGTVFPLLAASLRHFVFTRQTLERPWRFPLALVYWLLALPPAIIKRCRGAKLLHNAAEPSRFADE